eukprot:4279760-Pyramimonas_sp.AAC.1
MSEQGAAARDVRGPTQWPRVKLRRKHGRRLGWSVHMQQRTICETRVPSPFASPISSHLADDGDNDDVGGGGHDDGDNAGDDDDCADDENGVDRAGDGCHHHADDDVDGDDDGDDDADAGDED